MIQAVGHSPEPKLAITVVSDTASANNPARIKVTATDPDGNLEKITEYIVYNNTGGTVWAHGVEMTGNHNETEFFWPGEMFRISSKGLDKGEIYAINNLGVMANLSSLLAYSAPCIIELNESINFSAEAYFGEDGQLNALIDIYGWPHYISQDILNITNPGTDYQEFARGNITVISDMSKIGFIDTKIPVSQDEQASEIVGPIVLSGTPSSHYDLKLLRANAGSGEYIAIIEVEDKAANVLNYIAEKTIKVK
jgi:hypothetical protein